MSLKSTNNAPEEDSEISKPRGKVANSWQDMDNVHDIVEKVVYPMELDDEYDRGKINEFKSQVNFFQGALSNINDFLYDQPK